MKTLMLLLSNSLASFRKYLVKFKNQVSLMSLKFGLSLYLINWMLARNKNFHYKMFVSCSELILLYRIFLILHISSFIQRLKFLFYFIFLPMECSWVRIIYFSFIGLNLETRKVSPREKHFKQFYTPLICLIDLSDSTTTHGINIKKNYWERYFLYFHNIILLALTINIYCNIILHINYHFSSSSAWLTNIWAASEANEGTLFRWNKDYSVKITSGVIHHIKSCKLKIQKQH